MSNQNRTCLSKNLGFLLNNVLIVLISIKLSSNGVPFHIGTPVLHFDEMLTVAISLLIFVSNINFIACIGVFKSKVESTVVFGGSGGVGQLISQSLLQTKRFKVIHWR